MKNERIEAGERFSFTNIESYLLSTPTNSRINKILQVALGIGIGIVVLWLFYFAVVTIVMPYQIEYREGAAQVMTQILLNGGNPFSSDHQPLAFNNYGVLYNLIVLPLAALFGNTLLIHRTVTFFFIIFSCMLIEQTISRINGKHGFAIAGGVLILMGLASRGGNGAYPSALGTFLFLAAVLIPFQRSFDSLALCLSALLSLIAFYTKPYFVLSFGIVASYVFVFVSKKRGALYSFLFVFLFAVSYLLVRYAYKYYFIDTLISNISNNTKPSFNIVRDQLLEFVREFYPSIILVAGAFLLNLTGFRSRTISAKNLFSCFNFFALDRPLFSQPLNYFFYFLVCSLLAFVFVLGKYSGSFMTYFYQIVLPPFYLILFQGIKPSSRLAMISLSLLLFNMGLFGWVRFNPAFLAQKDSKEWAKLYQYVDHSSHILNTPLITSEMVRVGMLPVDSGQTEFYYHINPYANNKLIGPSYDIVKMNGSQYKNTIRISVINGEYDKIILVTGDRFFAPDDMEKYYSPIDKVTVVMPQTGQQWTVGIWVPINKN